MPSYTIHTVAGPQQVEGRKFSHYIRNVRFWFVVHDAIDRVNCVVVTHKESGKRVCQISPLTLHAALGDRTAAAKRALDQLVASHGDEKVYAVLTAAEKEA